MSSLDPDFLVWALAYVALKWTVGVWTIRRVRVSWHSQANVQSVFASPTDLTRCATSRVMESHAPLMSSTHLYQINASAMMPRVQALPGQGR